MVHCRRHCSCLPAERGIREPEMIIAVSAHAAFIKAAEYFNIRLVRVSPPSGRAGSEAVCTARACGTAGHLLVGG